MTQQDSFRTATVSRVILATPRALYRAHLDPEMLANWRAPEGMRAQVLAFDGRLGGFYRMALHYLDASRGLSAKSEPGTDRFTGTFEALILDEKIVEQIQFESDDPAFAMPMRLITSLRPVRDGTKVTVTCEQVFTGISHDDHLDGMTSALRNLALLTE